MNVGQQLYYRLNEFYLPNINGVCQLDVVDSPTDNHYFNFSNTLSFENGVSCDWALKISAPKDILQKMVDCPQSFEPRSSEFSNNVKVEGDLKLLHYFTQLLKRPKVETQALIQDIQERDYTKVSLVETSSLLDKDRLLGCIVQSIPVHMHGVLDWPAINWDAKELANQIGNFVFRKNTVTGVEETLASFIGEFSNSKNRHYTNGCVLPETYIKHFTMPIIANDLFRPLQIWLGKGGLERPITKLHCDFYNSFLGQVWGAKKLYLFSPDQYKYLYPMPCYNSYQPCYADPSEPDFNHYPLLEKAEPIEVVVKPGDLLIIPAGWFHMVWALDDVLSISRFLDTDVARKLINNG